MDKMRNKKRVTVSEHEGQAGRYSKGQQLRHTLRRGGQEAHRGRLHNVSRVKRPSRGIYGWQEQGHKSDVVTGPGAADRGSTVQPRRLVMTGPTGK